MSREAQNDAALAAELDAALTSGAFEPVFQPIARLNDGALAGFEALARWRRPDGSLWGPDRFLRTAMDHGLIRDVGRFVLVKAVEAFSSWRGATPQAHNIFLTVNVTGGDLERGEIVNEVLTIARGLPPGALKVELTESQILHDPDAAARACQRLRDGGVAVALDDFGAGFASLAWLARLPCDTLKIDRSFVAAINRNPRAEKIVKALVLLAHDLGLDVVAEGVERPDVRDKLIDFNCDYAQGHLFAPALSAGGAQALILTLASADPLLSLN
jgi:c-di-GMP-specific phosphodiesterase